MKKIHKPSGNFGTNQKVKEFDEETAFQVVATTLLGLEQVLASEIRNLGIPDVKVLNRAASFQATLKDIYRLNYHLRTALRILVQIASFKAANEDELYQKSLDINWLQYLTTRKTFAVTAVVFSNQYKHTNIVGLKVKDAIADRFRKELGARPDVNVDFPDVRINVHVADQEVTISLDSTEIPLYKRGYRTGSHPAQLNEVLAAGMILLSGWDQKSVFIDPMCGSGTLAIEAAMMANKIPPGIFRKKFGFEGWINFNPEIYSDIVDEADEEKNAEVSILASDVSKIFLKLAEDNAAQAFLSKKIKFFHKAFEDFKAPKEKGILMINPPYGERMKKWGIDGFYQKIGERLKHEFMGYEAWILSSNIESLRYIGLKPSQKFKLLNGDLECRFVGFKLYEGSLKGKQTDKPDSVS